MSIRLRTDYDLDTDMRLRGAVLSLSHGDMPKLQRKPKQLTVHADIELGPAINVIFDATKSLPFRDGSFDTIVAERTLCTCHDTDVSCGGIRTTLPDCTRYIEEVARVLNKANPGARARLTGWIHSIGGERATKIWMQAAQLAAAKAGVHIDVCTAPPPSDREVPAEYYGLCGLIMRPRATGVRHTLA